MPPPAIELVETRIGLPRVIAEVKGSPFWSSIDRQPTTDPAIYLTWTGLSGDQPTETRPKTEKESQGSGPGQIHGGNDKAVYVYPAFHLLRWLDELGRDAMGDRSLGENLRIVGASETDVHIGDRWSWGEAIVEVSRVRTPCRTLETYYGGQQRMIKRMTANRRCGWYLRVIQPGVVPTHGYITVIYHKLDAPTVAEAFATKMGISPAA